MPIPLYLLNYSIPSTIAYRQFLSPHHFAEYFRRICVSYTKLFDEWSESQAICSRTNFVLRIFHIGPTHEKMNCCLILNYWHGIPSEYAQCPCPVCLYSSI